MKILFSPSETKSDVGEFLKICKDSFIFEELYEQRVEALKIYEDFINQSSFEELSKFFGLKDKIPNYKLKQGEKIGSFDTAKFYKTNFSKAVDEFLKDEVVVDLRASFYDKFYKTKEEYFTFKFLKNNGVVSHWAKAYRGLLLKHIANHQISTKEELFSLNIENLRLIDIKEIKNKKEILLEIIE